MILIANTHCSLLHQLCEHDNDWGVVLRHHPPKVNHCVLQGALCHDERPATVVALRMEVYCVIVGFSHSEYTGLFQLVLCGCPPS